VSDGRPASRGRIPGDRALTPGEFSSGRSGEHHSGTDNDEVAVQRRIGIDLPAFPHQPQFALCVAFDQQIDGLLAG
jgi:hypothetical protein